MFQTVIVPLDESPSAEVAIPYAVDQATRYGATLVLVRVVARPELSPALPGRGGPPRRSPVWPADQLAAEERRAYAYLDGVVSRFRLPTGTEAVVPIGDPFLRLVAEIRRRPAPLVVVAAGGVDRLAAVRAELTRRLLRVGCAPILVVREVAAVPAMVAAGLLGQTDPRDIVVSVQGGDAAGSLDLPR